MGIENQIKGSTMSTIEELRFNKAWADPSEIAEKEEDFLSVTLVDESKNDLLTKLAIGISAQVQFPVNTAFLHGMGVIATAMTKSFSYSYYGDKSPVTLYAVTSQPPSTGKSGINKCFSIPVRMAFTDFNKGQKKLRIKIEKEISEVKKELKDASMSEEVSMLVSELERKEDKLINTPIYRYAVSNVTPEALESIAFGQRGNWNLISDEAGSINVLLGNLYSDNTLANNDIVLQSWDGDYFSSGRVTREGGEGYAKGSIAVIAQDETIDTILQAGSRGNGVSERFLLLKENNKLGTRTFKNYKPVSKELKDDYSTLINALVFSPDTVFEFSTKAMQAIIINKEKIEPHLADSGMYSSSLLRGVTGKMDKQVMKMSCILHVVQHWKNGNQPLEISEETVRWAIKLYKELIKLYIHAASSNGFAGDVAELAVIRAQMVKLLEKKKQVVTFTELKDATKGTNVFKGRAKLASYIKKNLLIKMIELNWCTLLDNKVVINPKLK